MVRRDQRCHSSDRQENERYRGDSCDVVGPKAVEQSIHQARRNRGRDETNGEPGKRQCQTTFSEGEHIWVAVAPKATRTPISFVRCTTA
jgi:hypothetical protein